jgi:hypothetical protein
VAERASLENLSKRVRLSSTKSPRSRSSPRETVRHAVCWMPQGSSGFPSFPHTFHNAFHDRVTTYLDRSDEPIHRAETRGSRRAR